MLKIFNYKNIIPSLLLDKKEVKVIVPNLNIHGILMLKHHIYKLVFSLVAKPVMVAKIVLITVLNVPEKILLGFLLVIVKMDIMKILTFNVLLVLL